MSSSNTTSIPGVACGAAPKRFEAAETQTNIRGRDAVPGFRRQPDLAHQRIVIVAIHQLPGRLIGNEIRNRLIRQRAQIELRGIRLEGCRAAGEVNPVVVSGGHRGKRKKQCRQDPNPHRCLESAAHFYFAAPKALENARPQILDRHTHRMVIDGKPGSVEHELGGGGPLSHRDTTSASRALLRKLEQALRKPDHLGQAGAAGPQEQHILLSGFQFRSSGYTLADPAGHAPWNRDLRDCVGPSSSRQPGAGSTCRCCPPASRRGTR